MATGAKTGKGSLLQRNGVTIAECTNFELNGVKVDFDDATNLDTVGPAKEYIPTQLDSGALNFTMNFLGNANVTQAQLRADQQAFTLSNWTIIYASGFGQEDFQAYVEKFDVKVSHDKKMEATCSLKITGVIAST